MQRNENNTKTKWGLRLWLPLLCLCFLLAACGKGDETEGEDAHVDVSDPSEGIYTAADLLAFFEKGEGRVARLGDNLDLDGAMLDLSAARGEVRIVGNGKSITSAGDCVIRMGEGASLVLEDVHIISGADGIGCLGDARIGGQGWTVEALTNGIRCAGELSLGEGAQGRLVVQKGSGLIAEGIRMEPGADIWANGVQSAVQMRKNDLWMGSGAALYAETSAYYCALKCAGILRMEDGASLTVKNLGDYHGAELGALQIDGRVRIEADGGEKGVGIFLFELNGDFAAAGHCEPPLRFESGHGALEFVETLEEIPLPQAEEAPRTEET